MCNIDKYKNYYKERNNESAKRKKETNLAEIKNICDIIFISGYGLFPLEL